MRKRILIAASVLSGVLFAGPAVAASADAPSSPPGLSSHASATLAIGSDCSLSSTVTYTGLPPLQQIDVYFYENGALYFFGKFDGPPGRGSVGGIPPWASVAPSSVVNSFYEVFVLVANPPGWANWSPPGPPYPPLGKTIAVATTPTVTAFCGAGPLSN